MSKNSIALGTFDGLHKGHLAVINEAKESAYPLLILLFNEHPLKHLTGKKPPELMSDGVFKRLTEKEKLNCYYIDFPIIADMSPSEFFFKILIGELNAGKITCGENYTFGKDCKGNSQTLKELCNKNGILCNIVKTVYYKDEPVSSTRIRKLIENGEMDDVADMLGRPFSYCFEVIGGSKLGRTIGFPTANQIIPDSFVQMKHGVYASAVEIDGILYPAVTNFGVRPTVDGNNLLSETHIIDYSGDLYSKSIEIHLLKYLRAERKLKSTNELSELIGKDCKKSIEIFNNSLELLK